LRGRRGLSRLTCGSGNVLRLARPCRGESERREQNVPQAKGYRQCITHHTLRLQARTRRVAPPARALRSFVQNACPVIRGQVFV